MPGLAKAGKGPSSPQTRQWHVSSVASGRSTASSPPRASGLAGSPLGTWRRPSGWTGQAAAQVGCGTLVSVRAYRNSQVRVAVFAAQQATLFVDDVGKFLEVVPLDAQFHVEVSPRQMQWADSPMLPEARADAGRHSAGCTSPRESGPLILRTRRRCNEGDLHPQC